MYTIKCPICGTENLNTNIRCKNCGIQLITEKKTKKINLYAPLDTQLNYVQKVKLQSFIEIFSGLGTFIAGAIIIIAAFYFAFNTINNDIIIICLPFFICILSSFIYGISIIIKGIITYKISNDVVDNDKLIKDKIKKNEKKFKEVENFIYNIYKVAFLIFIKFYCLMIDVILKNFCIKSFYGTYIKLE